MRGVENNMKQNIISICYAIAVISFAILSFLQRQQFEHLYATANKCEVGWAGTIALLKSSQQQTTEAVAGWQWALNKVGSKNVTP